MYWSFLEILKPSETCYVENIKSTNFILGTNTKSTNLWIHKIVIFIQTTKIDTHEEKYFHSSHIYLVVKWNVHINVFIFSINFLYLESEQNLLLNFIIIDQCKSVLFYRIWKLKKNIWNYIMSTYISNFNQYILNLVLCFTNI
jgi:hypothetical protein